MFRKRSYNTHDEINVATLEKEAINHTKTATYGSPPYAAVFHFYRKFGRLDNGNHLDSWELRGNMRVTLSDGR